MGLVADVLDTLQALEPDALAAIEAAHGANWKADIDAEISSSSGFSPHAWGSCSEAGTAVFANNANCSQIATGRYQITFIVPHPNGTSYVVNVTPQADDPNRDQRKIAFINKTANGFEVWLTDDDNGGTADIYRNELFDFLVI